MTDEERLCKNVADEYRNRDKIIDDRLTEAELNDLQRARMLDAHRANQIGSISTIKRSTHTGVGITQVEARDIAVKYLTEVNTGSLTALICTILTDRGNELSDVNLKALAAVVNDAIWERV